MSVLQDMTKGIMTTKATKAAGLTPVAGESGMTVAQAAEKFLPADLPDRFMAGDELGEAARTLREQAATLLGVADAIDAMLHPDQRRGAATPADTKKAKAAAKAAEEKAADERIAAAKPDDGAEEFKERMARLTAEAQAAVFTAADDGGTEPEEPAPAPVIDGWFCVEHTDVAPVTITPRNGKPYRMCGNDACENYER